MDDDVERGADEDESACNPDGFKVFLAGHPHFLADVARELGHHLTSEEQNELSSVDEDRTARTILGLIKRLQTQRRDQVRVRE